MKNVSPSLKTALKRNHSLSATPRLTAEWNLNRYASPTVANIPSDDDAFFDQEMFPLSSIVEANRPAKGINKALVGAARVADKYIMTNDPRFYVAGEEDYYKYWVSPFASDGQGNITGVNPSVIYERAVRANKIVVGVEDTWAGPQNWTIQTTSDFGKTWTVVSTNPSVGLDGRATLWWGGSSWSSAKPDLGSETTITGVRIVVTKLRGGLNSEGGPVNYTKRNAQGRVVKYSTTGANSHFSLIEISARLEKDLSPFVIDSSENFEMGETSQVTPVGTVTSNVGSVTLWNGDGLFSKNTNSVTYKGLIEPNVRMNLEYIYDVGGTKIPVQQFSMFVENWSESDDNTVSVDLADASKYLKEIYPQPMKFEGLTASQIIFRICDSIGFTHYVPSPAWRADYRIPVFWVDGEATVWEVFDDIARSTQTAVYFDAYGNLNVLPRERAFNKAKNPDWTLMSRGNGVELADIISLDSEGEYQSNVIKVKYRSAEWAGDNNGHPALSSVWEPEGDVVLRSTQLIGTLSKDDRYITISPEQAEHWPYEGHVQIEGEFIEYSGKRFKYWSGSQFKYATVKDQKQYDELNEETPEGKRHLNKFTGNLEIVERGVWDTDVDEHVAEAKGWKAGRWSYTNDIYSPSEKCHTWLKTKSAMNLSHNGHLSNIGQFALLTRGADSDSGWRTFGTRFKLNGANLSHRAGIVFNQRGNGNGYYVEVRTTNSIDNRKRNTENEITIYSAQGGNFRKISSAVRQSDLIYADTWHDLDINYNWASHAITVFLDGKRIFRQVVPEARRHAPGGKFGMFIRGKSSVDFEFMYAHARDPKEKSDEASFYDRVRGAYVGDMWNREWVYKKRKWRKRKNSKLRRKKNKTYRRNLFFFDEFGPYVHEVREFDVKFDPAPVAQSRLMLTNDWGVVCPEYRANAFGAYFILANASRRNEVVSGEDSITFAISGENVDQKLIVFGRALVIEEQEEVEVRNEAMVRARGEIVAEIDSDWIQSEDAAQGVADWIGEHWAEGADQIVVNIFGNPLFEIGDVVAVDYPEKQYFANTHKYFVTGINTDFSDGGIETSLTLQRNID